MAVQAQYPSNALLLPYYRNSSRTRAAVSSGVDNNSNRSSLLFSPNLNFNNNQNSSFIDEFQQFRQPHQHQHHLPAAAATGLGSLNPLRSLNQQLGGGPSHGLQQQPTALNGPIFNSSNGNNEAGNELTCTLLGSRKRAREAAADVLVNQRQQQQQQQPLLNQRQPQQEQHQLQLNVSEYQNHVTGGSVAMLPQSTTTGVISTGLRLAFEDDRLNLTSCASTSGRRNVSSSSSSTIFSIVGKDLSTQIQQQSNEIELLLKAQGEQVRQLLEEKRQRHSRALVAAIEQGIVWRFREKDVEIKNVKRQNLELTEHVKELRMEVHRWEVKAKTNEAMVMALKSNLQQAHQAVALSREQSKEGCGDSEADDAASSHHGDDDPHARTVQENRELREQRTCRVCRCNDVSILLLPCRHLCLCKECEARLDVCPLCRSLKNASVQVYMS